MAEAKLSIEIEISYPYLRGTPHMDSPDKTRRTGMSFLLRAESGATLHIELKDAAKLEQLQQKLDAALADVANARLVDAQASAARKEAEYWQNSYNAASRLVDEKDQVIGNLTAELQKGQKVQWDCEPITLKHGLYYALDRARACAQGRTYWLYQNEEGEIHYTSLPPDYFFRALPYRRGNVRFLFKVEPEPVDAAGDQAGCDAKQRVREKTIGESHDHAWGDDRNH